VRILLVTQYFHPEPFAVTDVARGLAARGHEIRVLTGIPNYPEGRFAAGYSIRGPYRERMESLDVVRVPLFPRGRGGGLRLALNYLSFAVSASVRVPFLPGPPPDVSLVYQMSPVTMAAPALALRLTHAVPVVVWVQDLWPQSVTAATGITSPALLGPLERFVSGLYRRSSRLLVQSPTFVDAVCAQGADRRRVRVLPNWADDLYLAPSPEREDDGLFRIVYAGNLGAAQGLEVVLDAATALGDASPVRWMLVGDGARREALAAEVQRRGLGARVAIRPRRPAAEMPALFASADALFVSLRPDPALEKTIPSKLQAYLASRRPLLASIDGEAARIVAESGAGVAVVAGDGAALAAAVSSLAARSRGERDAMGRAGRAYFEAHFSRAALLDRLEASLLDAVKEGS
jgi:colanic acid biosynthesis glycosyl transferase WcaI